MDNSLSRFKKPQIPKFSNPPLEEADNQKELLQKELDVNQVEQNLLKKRVEMMKEFLNDLPASDPQYSILAVQIQMDQVELDELKFRQSLLEEKISKFL